MEISEIFDGVYQINDSTATINLNPGTKVYGEKLIEVEDTEYRLWDPRRSKLCAAIKNGLNIFPFKKESKILYLGASAGTTPSHISDIVYNGIVYCVEFSPRIMRSLMEVCQDRNNMVPCLEDATRPLNYLPIVEKVDIIYCDVAQAKQSELFMDNMRLYLKKDGYGIIIIKSRSIDVTKNPEKVFREEERKLKRRGYRILEKINLKPYEKDHMAFLCQADF